MALPRRFRLRTTRPGRLAVMIGVVGVLFAGCATGPRPSFDPDQPAHVATGDPAIDAVLDRLDAVAGDVFTADYTILTRFGGRQSTATVVQAADGRRSVTINDVRFIDGGGADVTCRLATGECESTLNNARISDLQLTYDFYGASFASRLRADARVRLTDASGYTETIAEQPATCVDIPVSGGTKVYCALDSGPLARYDANDLRIDITAISPTADESQFTTG